MEGQCLLLLLLMDEGMACQYAHLSLQNEREGGRRRECVTVNGSGWTAGTRKCSSLVHLCRNRCVLIKRAQIHTRHERKMFITSNNSHNSLLNQL